MAIDLSQYLQDSAARLRTFDTGDPEPSDEDFYSEKLTRRQRASFRGARTEVRRTERELERAGIDVEQALEPGFFDAMKYMTEPIFDLLQVGQFVTAGTVLDIQRNGLGWETFKRAASEFANAMPFIEIDEPTNVLGVTLPAAERPSFSDVLKEGGVFSDEGWGRWGAAAAGLALDIVLDPITYTGFGLAGKTQKLFGRALDVGEKLPAVGKAVEGGREAAGKIFTPFYDLMRFGKKTGTAFEESAQKYIQSARLTEAQYIQDVEETYRLVTQIGGGMTSAETRLMGAFMRRPELMEGVLKKIAKDPDDLTRLQTRFQAAKEAFEDMGRRNVEAGLLDENVMLAEYAPGLFPQTGGSMEAMQKVMDRLGIEEARRLHPSELAGVGPQRMIGQGTPSMAKPKTHYDFFERLASGLPTEIDMLNMLSRYGEASARWRASRRLAASVLSDPNISRRVVDVDLGRAMLKNTDELSKAAREGDALAAQALQYNEALAAQGFGVYNPLRKGDAAYVLPQPYIKELKVANNIMEGKSDARKFFDKVATLQNVWKGYAVMSPGFHMRNMYSNWWNNFLGGVSNPKDYVDALRLQIGSSKKGVGDAIEITVKGGKKLKGQEIVESFRAQGLEGGMFHHDIPGEVEKRLTSRLWTGRNLRRNKQIAKKIRESGGDDLLSIDGRTFNLSEVEALISETAPRAPAGSVVSRVVGQQSPQLRLNRFMGSLVENNARMAHYVSKLKKGYTEEEAARSAFKYLFNYAELTKTEQDVFKRVIPFYSWMRFNVPLQLQSILEKPGRYAAISGKPIQEIESLSREWRDIPTPDYFQEMHAVRMPKEVAQAVAWLNGTMLESMDKEDVQPVFLNPNVPFQDLNRLNIKDFISGLSPFIKFPFEYGPEQGYSFFLDREVEKYPGEPSKIDLLGTGVKLTGKQEQIVRSLFPTVGKVQRLRERADRGQLASQLSTEVLGLKFMQDDVDRVNRAKVYSKQKALRALKQRAKDMGLFDRR